MQAAAARMARKHQAWHYALGVPGAIALPLSTATFFVESVPVIATVFAMAASVLVSLTGFLGEKRLAQLHWDRHDCLGGLAQKLENAVAASEPPTQAKLDELADEWTRCTGGKDKPRGGP